jgi:hypothetical protein
MRLVGFPHVAMRTFMVAVALYVVTASSAVAAYPVGHVAVALSDGSYAFEYIPNAAVFVFTPDGDRYGPHEELLPIGVIFDRSNRLWISQHVGYLAGVETQVWSTATALDLRFPSGGRSPVFDALGNLYMFADPYTASTRELRKYSSDGVLLATYPLMNPASTANDIDLAADQCTMLILGHANAEPYRAEIARYDVCRGVELPSLPIADGVLTATYVGFGFSPRQFRILRGGSMLIPDGDRVVLLDAAGRLLRTYRIGMSDSSQVQGVALDPDGTSFWLVMQRGLYRVDLRTGGVLRGPFQTYGGINGLAVSGEPRAAITAPPVSVPTFSTFPLLALATILVAVAVRSIC